MVYPVTHQILTSFFSFKLWFAGYMNDLTRLEKERNIRPSPEIDAFMKVVVVKSPKALKGILRMIFKIKKEDLK